MSYLLLLHELRVGAVIHHVASEYGGGQGGVDLFGIYVLELSVKDEVVARGANGDSGLLSEKNEREDIAILETHEDH